MGARVYGSLSERFLVAATPAEAMTGGVVVVAVDVVVVGVEAVGVEEVGLIVAVAAAAAFSIIIGC